MIKSLDCFENEKASALLEKIYSEIPVERTIAIAAVNALNQKKAADFPDDKGCLTDAIKASPGSKIAMVGFFGPVIKQLESIGAETVVYDIGKGSGKAEDFYPFLENEADSLILTSTSLLNQSTEDILGYIKNRKIPAVMLGPTTIMEPEIYSHLPVTILAGTVPVGLWKGCPGYQKRQGNPDNSEIRPKSAGSGVIGNVFKLFTAYPDTFQAVIFRTMEMTAVLFKPVYNVKEIRGNLLTGI